MLKIVAEAYNDHIFTEAIRLFGLAKDQLTPIDSNTDIVYEFNLQDRAYILKLITSPSSSNGTNTPPHNCDPWRSSHPHLTYHRPLTIAYPAN